MTSQISIPNLLTFCGNPAHGDWQFVFTGDVHAKEVTILKGTFIGSYV
jgi:hypothetical protein